MSQLLSEVFAKLGLTNISIGERSSTIVVVKTIGGAPVEVGFLSEINIIKVVSEYHVHLRCVERAIVLCYSTGKDPDGWFCLNDPNSHDKENSFPVSVEFIPNN